MMTSRAVPRVTHIAVLIAAMFPATNALAQVAVRGETVYTMAGQPLRDGLVIIRDGKIAAVGPADTTPIPAGLKVLRAKVVTPGLVDAHSTVGLTGIFNNDHDQDQLEHSQPVQPELRAIDAYNPHERLVKWVQSFGVTTVHTGHAPGELVSGQTMIVKTTGNTVEEALVRAPAAIAATFSPLAMKRENGKSPGTRGKMMAMLRADLIKAREYQHKLAAEDAEKHPDRDLRLEAFVKVLKREIPLMITAHRAQDIDAVLRLAREFDIRVILDGGAEAPTMANELKDAHVDVICHPPMMRAYGETRNASYETAAKLHDAGLRIALQSGFEDYVPKVRVVLFEAAIAAANGLKFEDALATITIDAARILGIDDRVGSLEVGKDGDVALYDGDPFEYTSHCVGVLIDGQIVSDTPR